MFPSFVRSEDSGRSVSIIFSNFCPFESTRSIIEITLNCVAGSNGSKSSISASPSSVSGKQPRLSVKMNPSIHGLTIANASKHSPTHSSTRELSSSMSIGSVWFRLLSIMSFSSSSFRSFTSSIN